MSEKEHSLAYPGRLPFSMNRYEFEEGSWEYTED
jgi:hypothetical protein